MEFVLSFNIQWPTKYQLDLFSSFQSLCPTLWDPLAAVWQVSLLITNTQNLVKLLPNKSVMPSNHLILCRPHLLLSSIFPTSGSFPKGQFFTSGGQSTGVSASPSNSGLIFFTIDWFDYLAVQWTLKSFLQHNSSKASIHQCSAFFIVQLPHPYMTTRKTIALTIWTFEGKVMSLLFNILSRLSTLFF